MIGNPRLVRVPAEPTEVMLVAALDWSWSKYGMGIGNDAAIGCWKAMTDAAMKERIVEELIRRRVSDLKKCPFCLSSSAVHTFTHPLTSGVWYSITCMPGLGGCGGGTGLYRDEMLAQTAWSVSQTAPIE